MFPDFYDGSLLNGTEGQTIDRGLDPLAWIDLYKLVCFIVLMLWIEDKSQCRFGDLEA
jgi:hypothetical protein